VIVNQAMCIGDEDIINDPVTEHIQQCLPNRDERAAYIETADRAYISPARELRDQNLTASAARLRSKRLERCLMFLRHNYLSGIASWLLDLVSGYGETPNRTFIAYIIVVLFFVALAFVVTTTVGVSPSVAHLSWDQSLVLSLTSFDGRGFFLGYVQLDDWIARIGTVEAVIGLFIELILIATFSPMRAGFWPGYRPLFDW
jgi:hypothetical protein